uniref:Ig-like domain-containing protein n=1 Tax=Gopherus agassizii TaxID=38772 RepID=A0A452HL15_9SAUR
HSPLGCVFSLLPLGGSCQAEVHQNLSAVTLEGQNGSISCHYKTSNFGSLQWFRQLPGGQPVSLLVLVSNGKQTKEPNLTAELDKGKKLSSLHIRESQLGDAATYFCAVATQ